MRRFFQTESIDIFLIFQWKHTLCLLNGSASPRRFWQYHKIGFDGKIRKNNYLELSWIELQTQTGMIGKMHLKLTLSPLVVTFVVSETLANSLDPDQIRPDKMLGLIWIQTVWHSDGIPERFFF